MRCYICNEPAVGQCQVCWKFYCGSHGDVICEKCRGTADASGFSARTLQWRPPMPGASSGMMRLQHGPGDPPQVPPGFMRGELLRAVLAIGGVRHTERAELTLLSLESYDDGFILHWRLTSTVPADEPAPRFGGMHPNLLLAPVHDDRGTEYQGGIRGAGSGNERHWRTETRFAPAIIDGATQLDIRVEEIQWDSIMPSVRSRAEIGPWTFEVSLADMKPASV